MIESAGELFRRVDILQSDIYAQLQISILPDRARNIDADCLYAVHTAPGCRRSRQDSFRDIVKDVLAAILLAGRDLPFFQ